MKNTKLFIHPRFVLFSILCTYFSVCATPPRHTAVVLLLSLDRFPSSAGFQQTHRPIPPPCHGSSRAIDAHASPDKQGDVRTYARSTKGPYPSATDRLGPFKRYPTTPVRDTNTRAAGINDTRIPNPPKSGTTDARETSRDESGCLQRLSTCSGLLESHTRSAAFRFRS